MDGLVETSTFFMNYCLAFLAYDQLMGRRFVLYLEILLQYWVLITLDDLLIDKLREGYQWFKATLTVSLVYHLSELCPIHLLGF